MSRVLSLILVWPLIGCVVVQNEVTNPVPGLSTVAVAPFINLSAERSVDGREMAMAYYSELQKTPGFEVVPVGVTEQVIFDNNLQFQDPRDAVRLAELMNVDAVVLGAVTDFNPYFPPRLGLKVAWYSPRGWTFSPGVAVDSGSDSAGAWAKLSDCWQQAGRLWPWDRQPPCDDGVTPESAAESAPNGRPQETLRGQSPAGLAGDAADRRLTVSEFPRRIGQPPASVQWSRAQSSLDDSSSVPGTTETITIPEPFQPSPESAPAISGSGPAATPPGRLAPPSAEIIRPLMAYTRLFDASDAEFVAKLRDYIELSGDRDLGGVDGHMHDVDRFVRFASHLMISEMLTLHGGEGRTRIVFKLRKHK